MRGREGIKRLRQNFSDGRSTGNSIPGDVNAVKDVFLGLVACHCDQVAFLSALAFSRSLALTAIGAAAHAADFAVGITQLRRIIARIDVQPVFFLFAFLIALLIGLLEADGILHQALGLPWLDVRELLRKLRRIGRRREGFLPENRGNLVVPMTIAGRAAEAQHDHIRAEAANVPDHVAQYLFAGPFCERFVGGFGKSEIDGSCEVLLRAVNAPRRKEFLGTDDAQFIALFRTNQILAAFASGQGQVGRANVLAARQVREHHLPVVIGMRAYHHDVAEGQQPLQRLANLDFPRQKPLRPRGRERHRQSNQRNRG